MRVILFGFCNTIVGTNSSSVLFNRYSHFKSCLNCVCCLPQRASCCLPQRASYFASMGERAQWLRLAFLRAQWLRLIWLVWYHTISVWSNCMLISANTMAHVEQNVTSDELTLIFPVRLLKQKAYVDKKYVAYRLRRTKTTGQWNLKFKNRKYSHEN